MEALKERKLRYSRLLLRAAKKIEEKPEIERHSRDSFARESPIKNREELKLLRLDALLDFFLESPVEAEAKLLDHFQKAPSAAFAYFLANYFLEYGSFPKAVRYFEKSAKLFEKEKTKQKPKDLQDLGYALAPALCPQKLEELEKYERKSWRHLQRHKSASWLWEFINQPLSPEQRLLALYEAYVFTPKTQKGKRKEILSSLQKKSLSSPIEKGLRDLSTKPHEEKGHDRCMARLKSIHSEIIEEIKKGANIRNRMNRIFVEKHISQSHVRQLILLRSFKSAYNYGAYLLKAKHSKLRALHVLRYALKLLIENLYVLKEEKQKFQELQKTLQALQRVYRNGLRRRKEAQALGAMLRAMDEHSPFLENASSTTPSTKKDSSAPSLWIKYLHRSCRSRLYNREALVILLAQAKYKKSPKEKFYKEKLLQRDHAFAEKELPAAFRHLGLGYE